MKIIDGMTISGGKEATMLSKGPWVLHKVLGNIINTEKGVKITIKEPRCWVYYKNHNQYKRSDNY